MNERYKAFYLIAGVEVISYLLLPFAPRDDWYFAACAAFNALTIAAIPALLPPTWLSLHLLTLSAIQLYIQFGGWCLYAIGFPPTIYNACIHIVVILTFLRILWAGGHDGTNFADGIRRRLFRLANRRRNQQTERL